MKSDTHLGALALRRVLVGELAGEAAAHTKTCDTCRARLKDLEAEQQQFMEQLPFERFAAGVERASRTPRRTRPKTPARWWAPLVGLAATLAVCVAAWSLIGQGPGPANRTKGGATVELVVAGPANGPQRRASENPAAPEALAPGELVRIGYQPGAHRYVLSVSIDAHGEVTALYPESGVSMPVHAEEGTQYLPGSLEFTGPGLERVIVVMSDQPLAVSRVLDAAHAAFEWAGRDVARIDQLDVAGEQFHRTFLKP